MSFYFLRLIMYLQIVEAVTLQHSACEYNMKKRHLYQKSSKTIHEERKKKEREERRKERKKKKKDENEETLRMNAVKKLSVYLLTLGE